MDWKNQVVLVTGGTGSFGNAVLGRFKEPAVTGFRNLQRLLRLFLGGDVLERKEDPIRAFPLSKDPAGVEKHDSPPDPRELMLDLKPGKYRYVLKIAGKRDQADGITLAADETWALLIGPGGILPLQMY